MTKEVEAVFKKFTDKWTTLPSIIGFTGYKGSGKTTASDYLCDIANYRHYRFAYVGKEMVRCMGVPDTLLNGNQYQKEAPTEILAGKSPRYVMQTLMTEWGRQMIHPDIWVISFLNRLYNDMERGFLIHRIVVDDVRFDNEAATLRMFPYCRIYRVNRDSVSNNDNHLSETSIDNIIVDGVINNDGTKDELWDKVRSLI